MKNYDIEERFNTLSSSNKFKCTRDELEAFQTYGYLIPAGNLYLTKIGKLINVEIIDSKIQSFNINFTEIISKATEISHKFNENKIYVMSDNLYKKYKEMGFIVYKANKEFFRIYDKELWLILKL